MSLIKTLKNSPQYQLNIVDIVEQLIPGKKTKYVELMLRLMKNTINLNHHVGNLKDELSNTYGIEREFMDNMDSLSLLLYYSFLSEMFNSSDVAMMQKFCEFNERGVIANNDISTYKSFDEIMVSIGLAEMKELEKELETQIIKIFEDNEWVIVKPLTFHASRKYGSSTKWCTTMENEPTYFLDYTKNGILIYSINKLTGFKVATHYHIKNKQLTFWDQPDKQVDSMRCGLPKFILEIIESEITNCLSPNNFYLSKKDKMIQERLLLNIKESRLTAADPRIRGIRNDVPIPEELPDFGLEEPMDMDEYGDPVIDERGRIVNREYDRIVTERRDRLIEMGSEEMSMDDLEIEEDSISSVYNEAPSISRLGFTHTRQTEMGGALVPMGARIREIDESIVERDEPRLVQRDNSGASMWISPRMEERMSEERVQRNTNEPQGMGGR